jgi:hypothetical protein
MRIPTTIVCLAVIAILVAGCSSTSGNPGTSGGDPEKPKRQEPTKPGASTKEVEQQPIRLEWRNLNARHGDQRMGLINRSSPDLALLYRQPKDFRNVKPVEDEIMANMLSAVRESDFFEFAKEGAKADDFPMGSGHGVVWVQIREQHWALVFRPGDGSRDTAMPTTYRDIKMLIMNVYNQTLWFSTSTSGGSKPFEIKPHKHQPPR